MVKVNMHEAKTHLSKLVDRAREGESVIIAKAGKPMVKIVSVDAPESPKRIGFLKDEIDVPDDFDRMGQEQIEALFGIDD